MNSRCPVFISRVALLVALTGWSAVALGQGAGGSNDAMLLLLEQNRNLQAEVQALRALVEEQGFEIRRLQRESLDRYTDTDGRLRNLEQALAGGGVVSAAPSGTGGQQVQSPPVTTGSGVAQNQTPPVSTTSTGNRNDQPPVVTSPATTPTASQGLANNSVTASNTASGTTTTSRSAGSFASSRPVTARPSLEPAVLTEQQLYQMAYDSAINSQFERAIAEFDQYLGLYPQGRFTTNSHYWKGQSYLYLTRYDEAIAEYSIILQQYPGDPKVPDSLYGQAIAYEGMGDLQRARQLLQRIMREYPNTGVANLADTRLRSLN